MRNSALFLAAGIVTILAGSAPTARAGVVVPNCLLIDDGISEDAIGLTNGGTIAWLQRQGGVGEVTQVTSVYAAYGTTGIPGSPMTSTPTTFGVWDDPNDDGNPNDLVLVSTVMSTVVNGGTDIFNSVTFSPPVTVIGVYFIGVSITTPSGVFPASIDTTSGPSAGRSFVAGAATGTLDLAHLGTAPIPPTDIDVVSPGVWLLRANCNEVAGTSFCEGTAADCPCANAGSARHGCANSSNASGAELSSSGTASIASDTVTLLVTGVPSTSTVLFAQSTGLASGAFGDGRQCLGGSVVRLKTRAATAGHVSFGADNFADPHVSVAGGVSAGVYYYQAFYRDIPTFCTGATVNSTNGLVVTWN